MQSIIASRIFNLYAEAAKSNLYTLLML